MLKYLPEKAERTIELGGGNDGFAKLVKAGANAEVWGVEYVAQEGAEAGKVLDKAFAGPIEENIQYLHDFYFSSRLL